MNQQELTDTKHPAASGGNGWAIARRGDASLRPGGRRLRPVSLVVAVLALVGVVLILLPTAAAWFSQASYSTQIQELNRLTQVADSGTKQEALAAAHEYNAGLPGSALIAAGERLPQAVSSDGSPYDNARYQKLLASDPTGLMARIKIPKIGADLPIYHGTDESTLLQGVGHLEGTALPVGGPSTHSVLTAHRGLANAELFTRLDELKIGDTFTIEVYGEVLVYRIIETVVVAPDETQSLFPKQGEDLVTLVTCTPLGVNSHRILVTGERVTPTPPAAMQGAGSTPDIPGIPWWAAGLLGTVIALGFYVWRASAPKEDAAGESAE